MLTVITPAASSRLTTVDNVRAEFPAITSDIVNDTLLGRWIDRASSMAVDYCGRTFAQETVRQLIFPDRAPRVLLPERYPVSDLTVTVDETELVSGTDYLYDTTDHSIHRLVGGRPACWTGRTIQLDYAGGYVTPDQASPTLPGDVEYAVQLWIASFLGSQTSATSANNIKSESVLNGLISVTYGDASTNTSDAPIRPEVADLLAPYRVIRL